MKHLGLLDTDRLLLLPIKYWSHHEFCFYLHDQMVELLVQYENCGAHNWVVDAFERAKEKHGIPDDNIDILDLLRQKGLVPLYRHHIVSHLVLGLTSDMLHFLYEALRCFEKRKFSVGFALLRKPLKENLLFLSWILGKEDDFLERFEKNNYSTLNGIDVSRRKEILSAAIDRLPTKEAFESSVLEEMIFSKTASQSFEPVWQRATHLITSQGAALRTEDLNINFIFHDNASDELYETLYQKLPYVLLYTIQVALECFSQVLPANEHTTSHLLLASMGAYECLFERRKASGVTAMLRRHLKPFLKCIHCQTQIKLTRENAIRMYFRESLECQKCGLPTPIPLYWIFARGNIKITRESMPKHILASITASDLGAS